MPDDVLTDMIQINKCVEDSVIPGPGITRLVNPQCQWHITSERKSNRFFIAGGFLTNSVLNN